MHYFPIIEVGVFRFDLSSIIAIFVSALIVFVFGRMAVSNLSVHNPSKIQNFMEWALEFIHSTIASTMPLKKAKQFISLGATLILFIFVSNLLGLPFGIVTDVDHDHHGPVTVLGTEVFTAEKVEEAHHTGEHLAIAWWKSPTADIAVTSGLALVVFFLIHYLGIRQNTKHYFVHFFEPYPIFFPLNLLKMFTKPLTLALRLYANIFAGEVLISTILMLGWIGLPLMAVWQGFSIFVGAIQAFLFTILTMVYISESIVHHEEDGSH